MPQLDAIADPVRLRLVRRLEDGEAASLNELAEAAGVHLNTARAHVAALEMAGVVEREVATPVGRGRPALRYRLSGDWSPPTTDFRGLAEVLAAALLRGGATPRDMHDIGVEWGRFLLGRPGQQSIEREIPLALDRLGFSARVEGSTLRLSSCPCTQVMPDRPELLCELAMAVSDGVLSGAGSGLRVGRRTHDPAARACCAELLTIDTNPKETK